MWWEDSNLENFHECLPFWELNFYLSGTEHVIYVIEKPLGNDFINISYLEGSLQLGTSEWVHYGVLHQSTNPPEDL
jgi:hypothetical protein